MASRYADQEPGGLFTPSITTQTTSGSTRGGSNQTNTGSFNENSTTNITGTTDTTREELIKSLTRGRETEDFDIDTMSEPGREALTQLIAQLAAGGTEQQRRIAEEQQRTLQNMRASQAQYSRRRALADAKGLMGQQLRRSMEDALPSILLAQAGAGTSGDALSALLSQDAATRAAEGAASVGVGAVADYGQILLGILGQESNLVSNMEDLATQALLSALDLDVGSMKRGQESRTWEQESTERRTGTEEQKRTETQTGRRTGSTRDSQSQSQWGTTSGMTTTIKNLLNPEGVQNTTVTNRG